MKKKIISLLMATTMLATMIVGCSNTATTETSEVTETTEADSSEEYTIAVVPKLTALSWYERMEEGVVAYGEENSIDVYYTGPTEADGALQAQCIEDLISQGVDAICVVPFSTESLESVLKKARDAGIVVITHEAAGMENVDYDVEAFNNVEYGEHLIEALAEAMEEEGEYVQTVGALTSASHIEWVEGAENLQISTYPEMSLYGDLIETGDDQDTAYNKIKEVLSVNPSITGIQGSAMPDISGAALAVEELGLSGEVALVGTALVSNAGVYVENGTIDMISFWDPALAGQAMVELAVRVLNGEEIVAGMDLGIE